MHRVGPTAKLTNEDQEREVTDDEKHEWCRKRGYPSAVFLPPSLFDAAEKSGYDMRWYVKQQKIPAIVDEKSERSAIARRKPS